jgi:hypothetical protein
MSDLVSLPDEVVKLVMQHVPSKQRLTSCCLVNKRLHAAAVAATDGLVLIKAGADLKGGDCSMYWRDVDEDEQIEVASPGRALLALGWLSHYGQYLTSL